MAMLNNQMVAADCPYLSYFQWIIPCNDPGMRFRIAWGNIRGEPGEPVSLCVYTQIYYDTLWLFNIAMENGPFIDGLPIKNGDFPWLC